MRRGSRFMNPVPDLPQRFSSEEELEEFLSRPSKVLIETLSQMEGDLMVLGVGGKMGPTLARQAKRAFAESGKANRVFGVSRFSQPDQRTRLEDQGIETISCDLLNPEEVGQLPRAPNLVFLVGTKFGTTGGEARTWAINTLTPSNVCRHFSDSRIVALSTGNVYPLTRVDGGGPRETDPVGPLGEYAQSALGRERVFEFFSSEKGIPVVLVRLNYAIDLRYGVLVDIAQKILNREPIDLTMGYLNLIWQGEANERILRSFCHCSSPPEKLNLTGAEVLSLRNLAEQMGRSLNLSPSFHGREAPTALLSNAGKSIEWFGPPQISVDRMIDWTADWVRNGGLLLEKPTHFETRDGRF